MAHSIHPVFISPIVPLFSPTQLFPHTSTCLRRRPTRARVLVKRPRVSMCAAAKPKLSPAAARSSISQLSIYLAEVSKKHPFVRRRLIIALLCIISSKLVALATPFLFQAAVDQLMLKNEHSFRNAIIAVLLHGCTKSLASLLHESRHIAFVNAGQRIGREITALSFQHIHSLEVAFHNSTQTGVLTRVVDRGTRSVMTIFRGLLFSFFPSMFELLLVLIVMFKKFSPWYAMVTFLTFFAFIAWTLYINDELGRLRAQLNAIENDSSGKLTDSLINAEAVKAFGNAPFELQRYDNALKRFETIAIRNERLFVLLNIGQGLIFTIGLTAILLRAATGVIRGSLSVGSLVMLSTMLQQLWVPLNFLGWQYREVKQSLIDVQNLFELLGRKPKIVDSPNAKPLLVSRGEIVFEDVTFMYPSTESELEFIRKPQENNNGAAVGERLALDKVSFHVPGGKSLALVGPSGSGKSTATRLLYRLYDIGSGKIFIDGQDISQASLESLRKAVSIVPQDTALFNDTIAYNIRYGRPDATDEEVVEAAKAASIHEVILRTAQGYDTLVGERGVRLSGGERQRLSVARAFLKGSRIILEDESTSALDTLTELQVTKSLQKLGMNRTRIIVAHRLSTIMNVDQVVVMKRGQKVEEGSFDELVGKEGGVFKEMWERQQKKEAVEEEHELLREPHSQVDNHDKHSHNGERMEGDMLRDRM